MTDFQKIQLFAALLIVILAYVILLWRVAKEDSYMYKSLFERLDVLYKKTVNDLRGSILTLNIHGSKYITLLEQSKNANSLLFDVLAEREKGGIELSSCEALTLLYQIQAHCDQLKVKTETQSDAPPHSGQEPADSVVPLPYRPQVQAAFHSGSASRGNPDQQYQ